MIPRRAELLDMQRLSRDEGWTFWFSHLGWSAATPSDYGPPRKLGPFDRASEVLTAVGAFQELFRK